MNINLTKANKSLRKTEKKVLKKARKFHKDNTVICAAAEAAIVGGTIYGISKGVKRSVIKDLQLQLNNDNQNPQPADKSFFEKIPVVGKTITKIKDKKQQKKNQKQNPADDKNDQKPDDKKADDKQNDAA